MVKITKVYTRTGDTGQTGLVGGKRLPKDHPRIEAYGSVDELNSVLGIVLSFLVQKDASKRRDKLELILEKMTYLFLYNMTMAIEYTLNFCQKDRNNPTHF